MREFQQICGSEPALTGCQSGENIFRREVRPIQRNLALAALLVEETYSLFAAMFFSSESFKLTTGEWMKGMGDAKLLWFYSTNARSMTPLPTTFVTAVSLGFGRINPPKKWFGTSAERANVLRPISL
jgi:hypothetical protein